MSRPFLFNPSVFHTPNATLHNGMRSRQRIVLMFEQTEIHEHTERHSGVFIPKGAYDARSLSHKCCQSQCARLSGVDIKCCVCRIMHLFIHIGCPSEGLWTSQNLNPTCHTTCSVTQVLPVSGSTTKLGNCDMQSQYIWLLDGVRFRTDL